ncbi:MAG: radical SAM protein [Patescibacteria group bacterium]|jgi:radical SAM superfamily enzyme YgiQ (UPF0313 family)
MRIQGGLMNKIILINPPFNIAKDNYDSSVSVGLLSIATYLDSREYGVKIIDGVRQKNYFAEIEKLAPDCEYFGLSVMTMQIPEALKISQRIKELNPKAKIIWGGAHPTFFTKETASHPLVDLAVFGEGEKTVEEVLSGRVLKEISGLAFKENGAITVNTARELTDPREMPLFNWDLVAGEVLENLYLIPSLTSRGCPHQCTFCINAILKNRFRPRSSEQVIRDLEIIQAKSYFKNKKIRFWDENFFVDINRAKSIVDGMISRRLIIPWETTVRANYLRAGMIDGEFMARIKKSGCYLLSFGAESGSPAILKKIKKGITPEEIINSAKMCLRHDIIPQYSFMIGLPGETKKDMKMTLRLIDELLSLSDKVQILGPQAFRPYPGSELYSECVKSGWRSPGSLEEWAELARNELSYLAVKNFPWVKDKSYVESMEAYVRFGAHSLKSSLGSSVKAGKWLKLGFVLLCKLRWKLKFFYFPVEFKLAKYFVVGK